MHGVTIREEADLHLGQHPSPHPYRFSRLGNCLQALPTLQNTLLIVRPAKRYNTELIALEVSSRCGIGNFLRSWRGLTHGAEKSGLELSQVRKEEPTWNEGLLVRRRILVVVFFPLLPASHAGHNCTGQQGSKCEASEDTKNNSQHPSKGVTVSCSTKDNSGVLLPSLWQVQNYYELEALQCDCCTHSSLALWKA